MEDSLHNANDEHHTNASGFQIKPSGTADASQSAELIDCRDTKDPTIPWRRELHLIDFKRIWIPPDVSTKLFHVQSFLSISGFPRVLLYTIQDHHEYIVTKTYRCYIIDPTVEPAISYYLGAIRPTCRGFVHPQGAFLVYMDISNRMWSISLNEHGTGCVAGTRKMQKELPNVTIDSLCSTVVGQLKLTESVSLVNGNNEIKNWEFVANQVETTRSYVTALEYNHAEDDPSRYACPTATPWVICTSRFSRLKHPNTSPETLAAFHNTTGEIQPLVRVRFAEEGVYLFELSLLNPLPEVLVGQMASMLSSCIGISPLVTMIVSYVCEPLHAYIIARVRNPVRRISGHEMSLLKVTLPRFFDRHL